jgi:mannose-6-phosphate isomerase-like protein (cupin superfamily)
MITLPVSESITLAAGEGERISFRGVEIVFKSPIGSSGGWTALDYTLPAGQFGAPLHYHRELTESFYVLDGELWMSVDGKSLNAGPGSFVLVPPGTPHSFANRSNAPARFLGHASNPSHKEFLLQLFRIAKSEPVWPPQDPERIIALGRRYDSVYL